MAGEGLPVEAATRVLDVTDSGYYAWRNRGPSARAVRHALVTETIRQVHLASRGTYGYRRIHAELTLAAAAPTALQVSPRPPPHGGMIVRCKSTS